MFSNFEKDLLNLPEAGIYNFYIIIIFLILITFSIQKRSAKPFFDISQTVQIKGLAIFFVVLGHFWVYIFEQKPLNLSSYSVSTFFILSGLAHGLLYDTRKFDYKGFIQKTIKRIFIPYWICTFLLLILDYYLLDRTHSVHDIFLTSLGINIYPDEIIHLDRTRWFISLLLLWYSVFCISRHFFPKKISYILYVVAFLLIVMRYFEIWSLGNVHNTLAFPFGYTIAQNRSRISGVFMNTDIRQKGIHCLILIVFCVGILSIKIMNLDHYFLFESMEKIFKLILLSYCLLIVLSFNSVFKYQSRVLLFLGRISYGLYLLNFPFIHRYNPLEPSLLLNHTVIMFYVLLMILILLSILVNALAQRVKLWVPPTKSNDP